MQKFLDAGYTPGELMWMVDDAYHRRAIDVLGGMPIILEDRLCLQYRFCAKVLKQLYPGVEPKKVEGRKNPL